MKASKAKYEVNEIFEVSCELSGGIPGDLKLMRSPEEPENVLEVKFDTAKDSQTIEVDNYTVHLTKV